MSITSHILVPISGDVGKTQVIYMKKSLVLFGTLILIYGIGLSVFQNFTFGTAFVFIIGVGVLLWGIFCDKIDDYTKNGAGKVIKRIIFALFCLEIAFVGFIWTYGTRDTADYNEDAVIVLGTGIKGKELSYALKYRLDKAIEYHKHNPDALIVVTGGQGPQESVTEGYAMERYLVQNGIPNDIIIKEERSTSTSENMRFSKVLIDKKLGKSYRVTVITNDFHIFRAMYLARKEGFVNATRLHSSMAIYDIVPSYLRESLAVIKTFLMD